MRLSLCSRIRFSLSILTRDSRGRSEGSTVLLELFVDGLVMVGVGHGLDDIGLESRKLLPLLAGLDVLQLAQMPCVRPTSAPLEYL